MTAGGEPPGKAEEELLASAPARRRPTGSAGKGFGELPEGLAPGSRAVHAGRRPDRNAGALVGPIYQTSTFHFPAPFSEVADPGDVRIYSRYGNPSQEAAAEVIRDLEGAEAARVFGSGMAAISTTLFALLRPGDTVAASEELYGGTSALLADLLPRFGVALRTIPAGAEDPATWLEEGVRVVYLETPTNPLLRVHDLARWAKAADAAGAFLVVDNTFATPINQRPLEHGADLVVHSASKYLGGHSDLLAGAVAGPRKLLDRIAPTHRVLGAALDPFAAFLLQRGMKTLAVRMDRHNSNGQRVAEALRSEPGVSRVAYPGSGGPEEERRAAAQMDGRGGLVTFELGGGARAAETFLGKLRLVQVASSLGGVESLISRPWDTSHAHLPARERTRRGITEGLLRLSCGIEAPEDIVRDLRSALAF